MPASSPVASAIICICQPKADINVNSVFDWKIRRRLPGVNSVAHYKVKQLEYERHSVGKEITEIRIFLQQ